MDYWPSYSHLAPASRTAYLDWLEAGRPGGAYIGYVFLFFYGIERRVLFDAAYLDEARAEIPALIDEVERLIDLYQDNNSFQGYAGNFLSFAPLIRGAVDAGDLTPPLTRRGWDFPVELAEGRMAFRRFGLRDRPFVHHGRHTLLFPWAGDRIMNTLALQLRARQVAVAIEGLALLARDTTPLDLHAHLTALAAAGPPDARMLAASVENKRTEKHHVFLSDELLDADYASSQLDSEGAWRAAVHFSTFEPEPPPGAEAPSSGDSAASPTLL